MTVRTKAAPNSPADAWPWAASVSADDDRRKCVEEQPDAEIGRRARRADGQQPSGQAGDRAGKYEGDDQVARHPYAGPVGCLLVAADHDEMPAERGLRHDQREDDEAADRDPGGERQSKQPLDAEPADRRREILCRAAAGDRDDETAYPDV